MLIYHGGIEYIREPKVNVGRDGLDFGKGFYTTTMPQQAQKWAERIARQRFQQPIVSIYEFDYDIVKNLYRCLCFEAYDKNWLDFIAQCRTSYNPTNDWDCIEGGIANDRVIDTVEGYINGTIDANHALAELSKHQPNQQICILNQTIVDKYLHFKEIM